MNKAEVTMEKPSYSGPTTLDISEIAMYEYC